MIVTIASKTAYKILNKHVGGLVLDVTELHHNYIAGIQFKGNNCD